MYQALYRKYRPKEFSEVVGQTTIVRTLSNEIFNNKLSHAYLFTGPRGTGKTSVAKIMAKTVNCTNPIDNKPCNNCVSCTQINNNQSIDIVEIDAASNNGVDEVRDLRNKVNLVPSNSKYKIYIIDEVHMMTTGAFNALLKTLEEPPIHVIFILATTDPQKLPTTILSRCQRFDFKKIDEVVISKKLIDIAASEKIDISDESILEISRLSDGGMRDALSILDQTIAYSDGKIDINDVHEVNGTLPSKELVDFLMAFFEGNLEYLFSKIDEYNQRGKNLYKMTEEIIFFCRNIMLYKKAPKYLKTIIKDLSIYEHNFDKVTIEELAMILIDLNKTYITMKESNNTKILLELFVIKNAKEHNVSVIKEIVPVIEKKEIEVVQKQEPIVIELPKIVEKTQSEINIDFSTIKDIRINNALANIDKKAMKELSISLADIRTLVINNKYKKIANILIDGSLKAFGNNQLIYSFDDENFVNQVNHDLILTEEIIKKVTDKEYKVIAVSNVEWDEIKKEYNSKTKQYKYVEDKFNIQLFAQKAALVNEDESDEILKTFGNIVKYK